MTRRFELTGAAAFKFCEVSVDDRTVTVRAGRIGTPGESKAKRHPSAKAAKSAAELVVWDHLAQGFVEVPVPPPDRERMAGDDRDRPKRVTLPTGDGPLRVRLERRGEKMTHSLQEGRVKVGGETVSFGSPARARDHLERVLTEDQAAGWRVVAIEVVEPEVLESTEPPETGSNGRAWVVRFRDRGPGLVARSVVDGVLDELATRAPYALHLRCSGIWPGPHWEAAISGHSGRTFPSLRVFVFDEPADSEDRQRDNSLGGLHTTLAAMPQLQRVFAVGDLALSALRHDALRTLMLAGVSNPERLVEGLGQCAFPQLEHLALSLSQGEAPLLPRIARSLSTLSAERLARVDLHGLDSVPDTLAALADLGPVRWSALMLSGESDEDALVTVIERHAAWLGRFATLGLPVGDALSEEAQIRVAALLPKLIDTSAAESLFLPTTYETWLE